MIKSKIVRIAFFVSGSISLILGIIGVFLPVLPTTPFVLLSAYCYARSSQRLYQFLINHKYFGKIIWDFQEKKIIRRKIKIIAISSMWITLLLSITFFMPYIWVKLVVIAIGISVTIYLVRFPSG